MPWNGKTTRGDRKRRHRREAIARWWRAYGEMLSRNIARAFRYEASRVVYQTYNPDDLPLEIETDSPQADWKGMRMVKTEDLQQ